MRLTEHFYGMPYEIAINAYMYHSQNDRGLMIQNVKMKLDEAFVGNKKKMHFFITGVEGGT